MEGAQGRVLCAFAILPPTTGNLQLEKSQGLHHFAPCCLGPFSRPFRALFYDLKNVAPIFGQLRPALADSGRLSNRTDLLLAKMNLGQKSVGATCEPLSRFTSRPFRPILTGLIGGVMSDRSYTESERRLAASIFFVYFGHMSLDDMRQQVGKRIGKTTIARDRENLKERKAPTQASAEAYMAALELPEDFDISDIDGLTSVINQAVGSRQAYYTSQPLFRQFTSATHAYPNKTMIRITQALKDRKWDTLIAIIDTFREVGDSEKYKSIEPYLDFYLGMAYRNLGDPNTALKHFEAAYKAVPEATNEETDFLCHAAQNYALALQDSSRRQPPPEFIDDLLRIAIDKMPDNYPHTMVNTLVIASRMPEGFFGITAERVAAQLRGSRFEGDLTQIRTMLMEQTELKDLHNNDMFEHVVSAIEARLAKRKGG